MNRSAASILDFLMKPPMLVLGLLVLIAVGCQSAKAEVSENVDESYRRLAEEALAVASSGLETIHPGYDVAHIQPSVAPDEIGPHLPQGALVVGTVTREGAAGTSSTVFLELAQTPEEGVSALSKSLATAGWKAQYPPSRLYSEAVGPDETVYVSSLCLNEDSYIHITARQLPGASPTKAYIILDKGDNAVVSCSPATLLRPWSDIVFPPLNHPAGASRTFYPGKNPILMYFLPTQLAARETDTYYGAQLQSAGWRQIEQGDTDGSAWSLWTFTDSQGQAWVGAMTVGPPPEPLSGTQFSLLMSLEAVPLGHSQLGIDSTAAP